MLNSPDSSLTNNTNTNPHNKARVATLIGEKIGVFSKPSRSDEINNAIEQFELMRKRMRSTVSSLRMHHANLHRMLDSRRELVSNLAALSEKGPLFEVVGRVPEKSVHPSSSSSSSSNYGVNDAASVIVTDAPSTSAVQDIKSYASIHQEMLARADSYLDKYEEFIIRYAEEWERVLTERVAEDIKRVDDLRRDLEHYTRKVNDLRAAQNKIKSRGKVVDSKSVDKMVRNEMKLKTAKQDYDKSSHELMLLLEEVVGRGWKDLLPMMIKIAQFDATYSSDEATAFESLNNIALAIKSIGDQYGLAMKTRLRALRHETSERLYTGNHDELLDDEEVKENAKRLLIEEGTAKMSMNNNHDDSSDDGYDDEDLPEDERRAAAAAVRGTNEKNDELAFEKVNLPTTIPIRSDDPEHIKSFKMKTFSSGRLHTNVTAEEGVELNSEDHPSPTQRLSSSKQQQNDPEEDSVMTGFVKDRKSTNPFEEIEEENDELSKLACDGSNKDGTSKNPFDDDNERKDTVEM